MTSTSRSCPLQYDSLKAVIQQLDPNIRFKLCLLLPSLRKVDRVVPLKIKRLEFKPYEFIVNETSYRLGIYRDYGEHDVPGEHRRDNEQGGIKMDLDQYGFFNAANDATTPGDIRVRGKQLLSPDFYFDEEDVRSDEAQLKGFAFLLAQKRGEVVGPPPVDESEEFYRTISRAEHMNVTDMQSEHDRLQKYLLPHQYRRAGTLPPYTKFAQLNISGQWNLSNNFQKDSRLDQMQKNLTDVLFGHRSVEIHVNRLVVDYHYFTIRLPPGLKIRIRELSMDRNEPGICKELESIVDKSSYPLEVVNVEKITDHPMVLTAKKLEFKFLNDFKAFLKIHSQTVTVKRCYLPVEKYVELVQNISDQPRETGTNMCFFHPDDNRVAAEIILEALAAGFGSVKRGTRSVTIPMENQHRQIVVSYEQNPDKDQFWSQWSIVFNVKVVEKE